MKIDTQKLDMQLAAQCLNLRDLRAGASPQTLQRIRRGEDVKPKTAGRIAKVLNCNVADILQSEATT